MPEGDSVFRLAHQLQFMVGKRVVSTSIRVPQYAVASFDGKTVTRVWPYGKHLFMDFEGTVLHTHLKMEGSWAVHRLGARWRKPGHTARVVLTLADAAGQGKIEVVGHGLGLVRVIPTSDYEQEIGYLGPDVLGAQWETQGKAEAVRRLAANPHRPVGLALLDQKVLAGVGNEYRAEICFLCGIHPATPVRNVDVEHLVNLTRKLMWANRLSPVRVTTGVRRPGQTSFVFGRNHQPCRRCGTEIVKSTLVGNPDEELERLIWWCPQCQPLIE